jgi:hypothetical protein
VAKRTLWILLPFINMFRGTKLLFGNSPRKHSFARSAALRRRSCTLPSASGVQGFPSLGRELLPPPRNPICALADLSLLPIDAPHDHPPSHRFAIRVRMRFWHDFRNSALPIGAFLATPGLGCLPGSIRALAAGVLLQPDGRFAAAPLQRPLADRWPVRGKGWLFSGARDLRGDATAALAERMLRLRSADAQMRRPERSIVTPEMRAAAGREKCSEVREKAVRNRDRFPAIQQESWRSCVRRCHANAR